MYDIDTISNEEFRSVAKMMALRYMQQLKIDTACREDLKKHDEVWESENGGFLYVLTSDEKTLLKIIEEEYDIFVWHIIRSNVSIMGEEFAMRAFLYISKEDVCDDDVRNAPLEITKFVSGPKAYPVMAYVYNETAPELSEMGTICVIPRFGGLCRTA